MDGGPHAYLAERFLENVALLQSRSAAVADAVALQGQREWMTPEPGPNAEGNTWNGDPHNLSGATGMPAAYSRDEINNLYVSSMMTAGQEGGGRVGDARVAKMQNDYLAAQERAYTLRTASVPRCLAFSAGRRRGHAAGDGVFGVITKNMEEVLAAAWRDNPNAPSG